MTDDREQRRQDQDLADLFSDALRMRAQALLREDVSIDAVAREVQVPINAVRHWQRECGCANSGPQDRPDWNKHDPAAVTRARHMAAIQRPAAEIIAATSLPEDVVLYIIKRAEFRARQRARKAAQTCCATGT